MPLLKSAGRARLVLQYTVFGSIVASLLAFVTIGSTAQAPPNPSPVVFTYTVKVVCATDGSIDFAGGGLTLGETATALADADLYQTAVNVFNPGVPTELNTRLFLAHDPGEGRMSSSVTPVDIDQNDALEFDCNDFRNSVDGTVPGGTGLFTIDSLNELNVVAVYTVLEKSGCNSGVRTVLPGRRSGTDCHGAGVSLDVEYITARVRPR